jgi:hypothetical protein
MANNFSVSGISGVSLRLRALAMAVPRSAARALNGRAEETMTTSLRLVPVDTGRLKSTGRVSKHASANEGTNMSAELSYGTEYALPVHEIPPDRARHTPPTQWKYLEAAVDQQARTFERDLAAALRADLGL